MYDYAIVGSGIGGSSTAAYLSTKKHKVILFEKASDLGGCSSTFKRKGFKYNTGATTLSGYQDSMIVKEIFDSIGVTPNIIKTDPTITIIQNDKTTSRYQDFDKFICEIQKNYPHEKNIEFWKMVYEINKEFYKYKDYYYSNKNLISKISSLASFMPLLFRFHKYLRADAYSFIKDVYGELNKEYLDFLEAQIMIVAQASSKEINFLTAALALGYTFNDNYYVVGGFERLFEDITMGIHDIKKRCEIVSIEKKENAFELKTKHETFLAKRVVLNSTVYDSEGLFLDTSAKGYFKKYEKLNNYQSSFMLYFTLKSDAEFEHHYQIINGENFKHTISKALFVSFSDKNDNIISNNGYYSVTVSIHTDLRIWSDAYSYKEQKKELQEILLDTIVESLNIDKEDVVDCFSATPKTFKRYIGRSQLGGNAMSIKNFLPKLPSNDTSVEGLYCVGDSVYAAQGWPGVMSGVKNLIRLLDE